MGDVDMAYLHARLGGARTWALPDRSVLPPELRSMRDPVVLVEAAAHGLPRARFDWDQECTSVFTSCGWARI